MFANADRITYALLNAIDQQKINRYSTATGETLHTDNLASHGVNSRKITIFGKSAIQTSQSIAVLSYKKIQYGRVLANATIFYRIEFAN